MGRRWRAATIVTSLALVGPAVVSTPTPTAEAYAGTTPTRHLVAGTATRSYTYDAAPGNSVVVVAFRDTRNGWLWEQIRGATCPSAYLSCTFVGRVDVPPGFELLSLAVSTMASQGVAAPQSPWAILEGSAP